MFELIQRMQKRLQASQLDDPVVTPCPVEEDILAALLQAARTRREVRLRDLHTIIARPQPDTLRAVETLRSGDRIELEAMMLDPLAGIVSLK